MRRLLFIIVVTLVVACASAQTIETYGDLRAKLLHVKERLTGQQTANDQAIAVITRQMALNFQGRLSRQQFQELADTIGVMSLHLNDARWRTVLDSSIGLLRQRTDTLDIQQRIIDYYRHVPQEHIYIHTDRPYYVPGDTVWMRAHLVDAVTHTPISRSKYIYVELLDNAADTLCQRIIVRCDSDGVFANQLILPRHLPAGAYTLAAYTQWMRNFPAMRFFYKQLVVVGGQQPRAVDSSDGKARTDSQEYLTTTPTATPATPLQVVQRKGQLLVRLDDATNEPLSCVIYGSGNLLVTDYTAGKVLRVDSQSLRPGNLSVAMVNRQTGDVVAERQTIIEGKQPQVTVHGEAHSQNEPMTLQITINDADGTPIDGNFSVSVTDYDVVKPDTLQPSITAYLKERHGDYPLGDMLASHYPTIDYGFQTSQTLSGSIRGTIFKRVKHPKLMLVRPDTGLRTTFELCDSSRFTINGLDFPDGTTYILEGMRPTGSTHLVQLDIDEPSYPRLHAQTTVGNAHLVPAAFARQAAEQVMYGSTGSTIELPEVVKEKKRQRKSQGRGQLEPFRAYYDDMPILNNAATIETLLSSLGLKVGKGDDGNSVVSSHANRQQPLMYIDDSESNTEELLMLTPANIQAIEYYKPTDPRLLVYRWDAPTRGVLVVKCKPGYHTSSNRPLSMVTVCQQGYQPSLDFYSPQYSDLSVKTRPDRRTTLYWNPKVKTGADGCAVIRFCASDVSKRYLVTIEGVGSNGTVVHHHQVVE